jgi:hypothetical protein
MSAKRILNLQAITIKQSGASQSYDKIGMNKNSNSYRKRQKITQRCLPDMFEKLSSGKVLASYKTHKHLYRTNDYVTKL